MPVKLAHIEHPAAEAERQPPLVIAHGLFGSARNFHSLGKRLAGDRRVILLDMRNHGQSPWDGSHTYRDMAEDLAEAIERLAGGKAVLMGHSMGGKAAMVLAGTRPELLHGLIVADIAPVPHEHSHLGYIAAMKALDLERVRRRSEADPMLAEAIPEAPLRAFLLQNLVIEDGRARWRVNLDALEASMEALLDFPGDLPEPAYRGPAFFLYGGRSPYVPPETHPRIRALFPGAEIEALDGAGHFLHAEEPEAFREKVAGWLARL